MRKRMTPLIFIMPRLIFETLSTMMIFMIIKSLFNHYDIGYIAVISIAMMTMSYQFNKRLTFRQSLIIGGVVSFALGFLNAEFSIFFRFIYGLYYLYIWIVGLRINVNFEYPSVYMKKFFYNSFAMIVMMMTIGLSNIFYYMNELSMYFIIYGLSVMLYIGKINIEAVYAERDANEIRGKRDNKYRGIAINMLVIFLIVFLIATALVENAGMFRDAFEMALRPIGLFGERLSHFVENRLIDRPVKINDGSALGSAEQAGEMMEEYRQSRTSYKINYRLIAQIIFIVGALFAIWVYARKLFKKGRLIEIEEEDYREIRENVFSKKLLYDNTLGKMLSAASRLFSRKKKSVALDKIRQKYLDTILELIESNQKIKRSDTPDEILKNVVLNPEDRVKFEKLTQVYKECRYSDRAPEESVIKRIIKLKIITDYRAGSAD